MMSGEWRRAVRLGQLVTQGRGGQTGMQAHDGNIGVEVNPQVEVLPRAGGADPGGTGHEPQPPANAGKFGLTKA